jgi:two-component system nitrate/nitrite sensor histidine kinase NarX
MSPAPDSGPFSQADRALEAAAAYQRIFEAIGDGVIVYDAQTGLVVEANPAASALHGYTREEFIGLDPGEFMKPASYDQFSERVQVVGAGDAFQATANHIHRDGTSFTVEVRGTGCMVGQRLCLVSAIRDVSERVQAERLLREQVSARLREQSILLEISQKLASGLDLKPGLILDQLRVIVEYTHAVLFVLQELELVARAVRGSQRLKEAMPFQIRLKSPESLPALLNGHQPQRIADVWSDDPAAQGLRSLLKDEAPVLLEGIQAWMWVPLAVKGRVIGGMGIAHAERDAFTTHQANLALTMANQAAITMVNAQLHERAQTLAALEERQRLAQNLHDAVNQSLFSASLIAEVLPRVWERDVDEGRKSLQDLHRLIRGAMAEMRGLLAELRPMVLAETEMGDLLRQLGDALTGRSNVPVDVTVSGRGSLPAEVQVAFYRVCQEALNNIAKHARAGKVQIDLQYEAGTVELCIRDDGRGFDPAQIPGHHGLSIMRERAKAVGAALSIASEPGRGTEIIMRWTESEQQEAQ